MFCVAKIGDVYGESAHHGNNYAFLRDRYPSKKQSGTSGAEKIWRNKIHHDKLIADFFA